LNIDFGDLLDPPQDLDSPTEIINKTIDAWASIMSLDVHMDLGACDSQGAVQIRRVVQEGLANSYRHGQATRCTVSVQVHGHDAYIEVTDNGVGLPANFTPGLGSVILESICGENWSLRTSPSGGCVLTAEMKLY
jgi:signal transduction histidine kinase